jgi:hypothetical protein
MLVLAMEFSRDAQRARRATGIKEQTDAGVRRTRARGRRPPQVVGRRRVGGSESLRVARKSRYQRSLPQNGIVMPVAIARAHRPHGRDIEYKRCAVRQGRDGGDSE